MYLLFNNVKACRLNHTFLEFRNCILYAAPNIHDDLMEKWIFVNSKDTEFKTRTN